MKVAAQLIVWSSRPEGDLRGVLSEVRSSGYDGVEMSPEVALKYKSMLIDLFNDEGLSLMSLHSAVGDLGLAKQALDLLQKVGGKYLTFSAMKGTDEHYRRYANFLNEIGRSSVDTGIKVCYHNHDHEISENQKGIRIIMENTDPKLVSLCVDTYWVKFAGTDPLSFLRQTGDRVAYLHLKDGSSDDMAKRIFCELGKGSVNFPSILNFATKKGMDWVTVEQDSSRKEPRSSMLESREYLKKIGY